MEFYWLPVLLNILAALEAVSLTKVYVTGMRVDGVFSMMRHYDLPEQFRIVSEVCGIETAKVLIKDLGGLTISIPKLTSLRRLLERFIKENIQDVPVKKIAMTLGMNERAIANILKKMADK